MLGSARILLIGERYLYQQEALTENNTFAIACMGVRLAFCGRVG